MTIVISILQVTSCSRILDEFEMADTRAVLRLECSLDCISGSPTKYFHFLTVSVSFEIKKM